MLLERVVAIFTPTACTEHFAWCLHAVTPTIPTLQGLLDSWLYFINLITKSGADSTPVGSGTGLSTLFVSSASKPNFKGSRWGGSVFKAAYQCESWRCVLAHSCGKLLLLLAVCKAWGRWCCFPSIDPPHPLSTLCHRLARLWPKGENYEVCCLSFNLQ